MAVRQSFFSGVAAAVVLWALASSQVAAQTQTPSLTPAGPSEAAGKTTTAENADTNSVAEVMVTARRSSEKLQDVPLAITSATSSQLTERQITDLQGLAKYVPNFQFRDFVTGFHGNPTLRGMNQINTSSPVTNVGVFVDGVYLQRDYQINQSLGDYDRIEVVKGPQSALYGANTFAGAINYVTKRPTNEFSANGEATLGSAGFRRFQVGVGGPIIKDLLSARVYFGSDEYDGTIKNNLAGTIGAPDTFGGHDRTAFSGALRFTPLSNLTIDAYYSHSEKSEAIRPYYTLSSISKEDRTNCGAIVPATGRGGLFCGVFSTDPSQYRTGFGSVTPGLYSNIQPDSTGQNDVYRLSAEWVINPSLTAHYTFGRTQGNATEDFSFFSNNYNPSLTAGPASFSQQIEGGAIDYTSHEARLNYDHGGPIKAEIGYFHSDTNDRYFLGIKSIPVTGRVIAPFQSYNDADNPLAIPAGVISLNNLQETFAVNAFFGRVSYNFLDERATLAAELRYTMTDLVFNDIAARRAVPSRPLLKASYADPTPRFTAEYKLTRDNLIYASAAEGVKTGGFNGYVSGTLTLVPGEQSYGEEQNWTYEVGTKNSFFDRKLFLNATAFYIDWSKKLGSVAPTGAVVNLSGVVTVANIYKLAGGLTNYGLEVDGQYRPIRPLTVSFSFAAQHPTYDAGATNLGYVGYCSADTCRVNGDISGNTIERTSELSGTIGLEYRDHLIGDLDFFGGVDATYQSLQYADQNDLGKVAPYTLINARAGIENGRWKAFVWAKNLGDELYVDNSFYVFNVRQFTASFGERRTVGVTLTANF